MNGIDIINNIIYGNGDPGIIASYCYGSGVGITNNLFLYNSGQDGSGAWNMNFSTTNTVTWTAGGNITNSDPSFVSSPSDWVLPRLIVQ